MLSHLSFGIADLGRSAAFYDATLAPLGFVRIWTADDGIGYGPPGELDVFAVKLQSKTMALPGPGFHLAFTAPHRDAVDQFYAAALAQGGRDAGGPGLRPNYGPSYYAAFVFDPDGYKLEAVHQ
ncbi:VOC family protein [Sphingomonas edaphi]|uniref:VOC family protein n=2 Tax=Sphingomonas edaphi TaxID=2315689 RepID=A0A418PY58_9SPHN|nr:VOC family protein [Sphingomonas edaphi]